MHYNRRLYARQCNWVSAQNWRLVLNHPQLLEHPVAVRNIKRIMRKRRNPALIHKGGKP
jgi:hypothetical protein